MLYEDYREGLRHRDDAKFWREEYGKLHAEEACVTEGGNVGERCFKPREADRLRSDASCFRAELESTRKEVSNGGRCRRRRRRQLSRQTRSKP